MRNVAAAWLLALCLQAACSQTTDLNLPPEDLDSSGDDDDTFSGSGAGPLTEHSVAAWNVSLQHADSSKSAISTEATALQPETPSTENPAEKEVVSSPTAGHVAPEEALQSTKDTDVLVSADEKPTVHQPVTTSSPTTPRPAVRVTTSQVLGTVHITEPGIQGSSPSVSKERLKSDFTTLSEDGDSPTTILPRVIEPIDDKEMLFPESSGEPDDFTFTEDSPKKPAVLLESELVDSSRDAEAAGTSQGLMDKKEVLGGVIAGGLVGLLFAVFLVGFMLYRMKKKDEGSYSLDEPKQSNGGYQKPQKQEEFYA